MNSHHDTPSEDGREPDANDEQSHREFREAEKSGQFDPDYPSQVWQAAYRAGMARIEAAKDAEIAKFKEANRELSESNTRRRDKIVELMLKLDAQPARQVVVMPEPLSRDDYSVGMYGRAMIRGYESCRREVARLNRNAIPVELINRALQTPIGPIEFADREAAQNELRALIGK